MTVELAIAAIGTVAAFGLGYGWPGLVGRYARWLAKAPIFGPPGPPPPPPPPETWTYRGWLQHHEIDCENCEWVKTTIADSPRQTYVRSWPCPDHEPRPGTLEPWPRPEPPADITDWNMVEIDGWPWPRRPRPTRPSPAREPEDR